MIEHTFSLSSDEIVRGDHFSRANEPALTILPSRNLIYLNAASLKRLPGMEYALLLICAPERRLSIFPCGTCERDAVRMRAAGADRRRPRHIRCRDEFISKLVSLMEWDRAWRYRAPGYVAVGTGETILAFDLASAEAFHPGGRAVPFPCPAGGGFGAAPGEQRAGPLIRTFSQDAEIALGREEDSQDDFT